jgi:hypothetical protein
MLALLHLFAALVSNRFKSRRRLEIENLYLRHQLNIALRRTPRRLQLRGADRALLVWMTWLWPKLLDLSRTQTRSYAGTEQDFEPTGVGSLAVNQDAPRLVSNCANLYGR